MDTNSEDTKSPSVFAISTSEKVHIRLAALRAEHRDLDDAIRSLGQNPWPDMLQMQRLKRKKLQLRDEISQLESDILPDIIA